MRRGKTWHCTGCENLPGKIADRCDKHCCTCCLDENDNRPGRWEPINRDW